MKAFIGVLARVGLVLILLAIALHAAKGHSWYEAECCNTSDCRPAQPDEVRELADGYHVWGTVVPYGDKRIRVSVDNDFHVCGFQRSRFVRCIYVPGRGT